MVLTWLHSKPLRWTGLRPGPGLRVVVGRTSSFRCSNRMHRTLGLRVRLHHFRPPRHVPDSQDANAAGGVTLTGKCESRE